MKIKDDATLTPCCLRINIGETDLNNLKFSDDLLLISVKEIEQMKEDSGRVEPKSKQCKDRSNETREYTNLRDRTIWIVHHYIGKETKMTI